MSRFWTLGVMMMMIVGGCMTTDAASPDAAAASASDGNADTPANPYAPDDGFGAPCVLTSDFLSACNSLNGLPGWCASTAMYSGGRRTVFSAIEVKPPVRLVCRRRCADQGTACPAGQTPVPIVDNQCLCLPPAPQRPKK